MEVGEKFSSWNEFKKKLHPHTYIFKTNTHIKGKLKQSLKYENAQMLCKWHAGYVPPFFVCCLLCGFNNIYCTVMSMMITIVCYVSEDVMLSSTSRRGGIFCK